MQLSVPFVALALSGLALPSLAQSSKKSSSTELWSTSYNYRSTGGLDPKLVERKNVTLHWSKGPALGASINATDEGQADIIGIRILENRKLQQMEGVGCGVTDSASISLQDLKSTAADLYSDIMSALFDPSENWRSQGGASLSFLRSPLGSSDFAHQLYSYDDTTDCSSDEDLKLFSIDKAPKMWSTHQDALKLNPDIRHFFAPWSPPAWMKATKGATNCSMIGGSLQAQFEGAFGSYLVKSMAAIKSKLGKSPYMLSLQNEPLYLPDNYPGNLLSSAQAAAIGDDVRKKLDAAGLKDVGLTAYDHNWDNQIYATRVFDASDAFGSVSWHCYGGSADGQRSFNEAYPDTPVYMTECTRITQYGDEPWKNLRENTIKLLMGSITYGSKAIILWNCVLMSDNNGFTSPTLPNVCKNCLAPVLVYNTGANAPGKAAAASSRKRFDHQVRDDEQTTQFDQTDFSDIPMSDATQTSSAVKKYNGGKPWFKLTSDFALLAHLSRAVTPPASALATGPTVRTGVNTTEQLNGNPDGDRVLVQAYKTPLQNGKERIALNILQKNDHFLSGEFDDVTLKISFRDVVANVTLGVGLHTLIWEVDAEGATTSDTDDDGSS